MCSRKSVKLIDLVILTAIMEAYKGLTLHIVIIFNVILEVICFCLGVYSFIWNNLKVAASLAGFCFFGELTLQLGLVIGGNSSDRDVIIASTVFSLLGALACFTPDKIKHLMIGAGVGASISNLLSWYFYWPEISLSVCIFLSALSVILAYRYSEYTDLTSVWLSSYYIISSLALITDFCLSLCEEPDADFMTTRYFIGSIAIVNVLALFTLRARFIITKAKC